MAKGKVQHWKHGWIPLDSFAMAEVAKKDAPKKRVRKPANWVPDKPNVSTYKTPTDAERKALVAKELAKTHEEIRAEERKAALTKKGVPRKISASESRLLRKNYSEMTPEDKIRAAEIMYGKDDYRVANLRAAYETKSAAELRQERYRQVDTVDGVDFVTYKSSHMDPLGTDHGNPHQFTHDEQQTLADAYNEVKAEFPGMQSVQIVGVDGSKDAFGITSWDGRRISMSSDVFDPAKLEYARKNWYGPDGKSHGAIAGQFVDDPEGFARAVMTHELGHALQMQDQRAKALGEGISREGVSAKELGLDTTDWAPGAADDLVPRWTIDTLGGKSVYATGNKFEWFAEAFADGFFEGDKAPPQSQKVLAMLKKIYGEKAAAA